MTKVWTRVVEDLQKYSNQPVVEKTFLQKMWNIVFTNNNCNNACNQGRNCVCR